PSTKPLQTGEMGLLAVHRTDPGLMLGYWNRNDEEREVFRGEWFIGGDLAEMDHDGYIIHHGRDNDVMKPLGYRIAPQEIEDVLVAHSGVAEAACTEVEIKNGVRVIAAFIVPEHPTSPPSEADLLKHANANLAAYKCPRIIQIVDTLPRTANGKLTRSRLATRVNT
ncbi:MAG: AMP-dependent synthetase, partial [Pseudomonadota bacterium]